MKRTTIGWLAGFPVGIAVAIVAALYFVGRIAANHAAAVYGVADPVTNLVGGFINVILFGFLTIVLGFGAAYFTYDLITRKRK